LHERQVIIYSSKGDMKVTITLFSYVQLAALVARWGKALA
jgi:hypothetical protein